MPQNVQPFCAEMPKISVQCAKVIFIELQTHRRCVIPSEVEGSWPPAISLDIGSTEAKIVCFCIKFHEISLHSSRSLHAAIRLSRDDTALLKLCKLFVRAPSSRPQAAHPGLALREHPRVVSLALRAIHLQLAPVRKLVTERGSVR